MKNFIPQTKAEAVADYVRVAREYWRVGTRLFRETAKKALAKAKRIKAADDWRAEMFAGM